MNGRERVALQEEVGVREMVADVDQLRCKYGIETIQTLTPKADINLRLGRLANKSLKVSYTDAQWSVTLEFPKNYPHNPLHTEIASTALSDTVISEIEEDVNLYSQNCVGDKGYAVDFMGYIISKVNAALPETHVASEVDKSVNPDTDLEKEELLVENMDSSSELIIYKCKMCRCVLFDGENVEQHENLTSSAGGRVIPCSSVFLDDSCEWVKTFSGSELSGKIYCPSCKVKLGAWNWSGSKCSCGSWIVPAFQVLCSKVDTQPVHKAAEVLPGEESLS